MSETGGSRLRVLALLDEVLLWLLVELGFAGRAAEHVSLTLVLRARRVFGHGERFPHDRTLGFGPWRWHLVKSLGHRRGRGVGRGLVATAATTATGSG